MAKESVSKLVSKGAKVTKGVVTGVAKGATGVAKTASKAAVGIVGKAASTTDKLAQGVASNTTKSTSKAVGKLRGLCNLDNIVPCVTALTLIAYIVIVSPTTVLDMFSTRVGKALSMLVVLIALLFDVKLGVMLGLAVILSISLSSVNKDLYESYNGGVLEKFETENAMDAMYDVSENDVSDVVDEIDLAAIEQVADEDVDSPLAPVEPPVQDSESEWKCTRMEKRENFVGGSNDSEPYDIMGVDSTVCKYASFSNDS